MLDLMTSELVFLVEEDPEGGFVARALGESVFTQAETLEGIEAAVRDALACHYETRSEIPKIVRLHYVRDQVIAV